jgi:hypothetical protein
MVSVIPQQRSRREGTMNTIIITLPDGSKRELEWEDATQKGKSSHYNTHVEEATEEESRWNWWLDPESPPVPG